MSEQGRVRESTRSVSTGYLASPLGKRATRQLFLQGVGGSLHIREAFHTCHYCTKEKMGLFRENPHFLQSVLVPVCCPLIPGCEPIRDPEAVWLEWTELMPHWARVSFLVICYPVISVIVTLL